MSELCLKNQTVLTLKDNKEGVPSDILKIEAPELLPLFLAKDCTWEKLNKWLKERTIPDDREGLDVLKKIFGDKWLLSKNYLSLSDQYWIKKRTEKWGKINYFENTYSHEVGDMFFLPWSVNPTKGDKMNNNTPDITTGGVLKKRWRQRDNKTSYLVKAGSKITRQDPLNEVLVSVLIEQLGVIESAGYDLCIEGTTMCSKCNNFITVDTELVPAYYIYYDEIRDETKESVYDHLIRMCQKHEIPGAEEYIQWLIFIDKLTGNTDRTLSNIAFIRNVNTLKFVGPSPVFDCGNAYWDTKMVNDGSVKSKLFGDIELVIFKKLREQCDIEDVFGKQNCGFKKIISDYPCISDKKKQNLIAAIEEKNNYLLKTQMEFNR